MQSTTQEGTSMTASRIVRRPAYEVPGEGAYLPGREGKYTLADLKAQKSNSRGFYEADDAAGRWLRTAERKRKAAA
jgi:hypothetical protein